VTTVGEALDAAVRHHRDGELPQAESLYRQILATIPDHLDALHLLGLLAHHTGRLPLAIDLLRRATQLNPTQLGWHAELARALLDTGDYQAAAVACEAELKLDPQALGAWTNLGVCRYEQERLDEAADCFRRMLAIEPQNAVGWHNLAAILLELGNAEEAAEAYDTALQYKPDYVQAYSNRLTCEQYRTSGSPESLLALSIGWDECFARAAPQLPAYQRHAPSSRLRIGFVSPDFYRAPAGYFLTGLLEALAREPVDVFLYSDTPRSDDLTQRMQTAATGWRDVRGKPDAEVASLIRMEQIDVLVDLAGHSKGNRLGVFALRAATMQITWAGYAGTTGLAAMDYLLADRFEVPDGCEAIYRERVLRMPHDYICYLPPHYAPPVAQLPASTNGYVTFAAFHNAAKCGSDAIALWAQAMLAVPASRIVLKYRKLDQPQVRNRILRGFADHGITADRITIEGTSPHGAMLARYNDVDMGLDSPIYSGGLTTCEALWMGVPVVTLPGQTFARRHSLSHLSNVGLTELVANDEAEFVALAASLAGDMARLSSLRATLRQRVAASPLCDYAGFAKNFLAVLRSVAIHSV
jgi:predicted O-linked N-acetylglucosamine transferase (SPINDLY family)